jgi:hypothetical protein
VFEIKKDGKNLVKLISNKTFMNEKELKEKDPISLFPSMII